mgnify:FL=1
MYLRIVIFKARALGWLSRTLGRGNGIVIAGHFINKFAPNAVKKISANMRVILISGTNGKSTTAKLIAEALGTKYSIAHNHTGANLFSGVAAALGANPNAEVAVLEVDELVLPWAIEQTNPELVVLLNLGRDQLDRLSEVRLIAQKWQRAIGKSQKVLASADDPFVVFAAANAGEVTYFSAQSAGHIDATTCPKCGALLNWSNGGLEYSCECGFGKPKSDWSLIENKLVSSKDSQKKLSIKSSIPGAAALQNSARALIVADTFGIDLGIANEAISKVKAVDGRFAVINIGHTKFRLLLSKNPASWRETLSTSSQGPREVLLVVNANTQDGKDTSWLWDVDFKKLAGRQVLVTGDRRVDVSARLTVDGISHRLVDNEYEASKVFGPIEADLIASYTAFHRLANS